jgi:hypothetical protein
MIALVLEDTDSVFKSLDGKIRRICRNLDTDPTVRHRRTTREFEQEIAMILENPEPTMLVFCDIEDAQGERFQSLGSYMKRLWETIEPDWIQHRPMIVFTRSDDTYQWMKGNVKHTKRPAPSAIILQTPGVGHDPLAELRDALSAAIESCIQEQP